MDGWIERETPEVQLPPGGRKERRSIGHLAVTSSGKNRSGETWGIVWRRENRLRANSPFPPRVPSQGPRIGLCRRNQPIPQAGVCRRQANQNTGLFNPDKVTPAVLDDVRPPISPPKVSD
jgi:hypothetical protein